MVSLMCILWIPATFIQNVLVTSEYFFASFPKAMSVERLFSHFLFSRFYPSIHIEGPRRTTWRISVKIAGMPAGVRILFLCNTRRPLCLLPDVINETNDFRNQFLSQCCKCALIFWGYVAISHALILEHCSLRKSQERAARHNIIVSTAMN
jgi:hypothetical protein